MAEPGSGRLERLLGPRNVVVAVAAMLVTAVLLVPSPEGDDTATPSSYGTGPLGARGFYEVLERLGYAVERRIESMREPLDTGALYVLLEPGVAPTAKEVNRLLDAVRSGAALLVAPRAGSRLADSLGVRPASALPADDEERAPGPAFGPGRIRSVLRQPEAAARGSTDSTRTGQDTTRIYVPPPGSATLATLRTRRGVEPTIVAMPLGRGSVLILAEAGPFQNEVMRLSDAAVRAIRLAERLAAPGERRIVFDEYHHGHGLHPNMLREARFALTKTPAGRVIAQFGVAGLVLLLAVGARPVRPRPRERIERRSPLEHVGALARAYAAVNATGRAALLLVRGLIRRHGSRARDEAAFLRAVAAREPDVREQAAALEAALAGNGRADPAGLAAAAARIEAALESPELTGLQ